MKRLVFSIFFVLNYSVAVANACEFDSKSKFGSIHTYLRSFLKQNKQAAKGTHTFIVDPCSQGDSKQHSVYWIDGKSIMTVAWPPATQNDFNSLGKNTMFSTDLKNNLVTDSKSIPAGSPIGLYQLEDWAKAFLLSIAKDGVVIHVLK